MVGAVSMMAFWLEVEASRSEKLANDVCHEHCSLRTLYVRHNVKVKRDRRPVVQNLEVHRT
jgi:hypothetical protein